MSCRALITLVMSLGLLVGCNENAPTRPTPLDRGDISDPGAKDIEPELSFLLQPSGPWTSLASMRTARHGLASTALGGLVYAMGGAYRSFDFHSIGFYGVVAVEVYNPATNTWTAAASLPVSRVYPNGSAAIRGRIYLPGGAGCDSPIGNCRETNTLFIFDPSVGALGTWTVGPPMPVIMEGGTSGAINDQLYVLAGWSVGAPRNFLFRFDPVSTLWTRLTDSPNGHTFGASAVVDGKLYASGGQGRPTALSIYDPASDSWTSKAMPVGYQHHAAVAIGNLLYLVGGQQIISGVWGSGNLVMAYDPQDDSWTTPAPVPAAGGPYSGNAGLSLTFAGTSSNTLSVLPAYFDLPAAASVAGALYIMGGTDITGAVVRPTLLGVNPPGAAALTYNWDFGDGQQGTGETPAHVYAAPGTYTLTLTVSTPDGRSGSTTTLATIAVPTNAEPMAAVGGPYVGDEGSVIEFSGVRSTDPDNDALTYAWNFGDGSTGTGATPSHTYADNGTFTVTLTVDDGNGGTHTATTTATIASIAPDATLGNTGPVDEGQSFTLTMTSPTDPSSLDVAAGFSHAFDCGAGTGLGVFGAGTLTNCSTSDNGVRSVAAQIRDKDGATRSKAAMVTVNDIPPVITAPLGMPTSPLALGTPVSVTTTFSGAGVDAFTAVVNWGSSSTNFAPTPGSFTATHTYAAPGVYTVSVNITDDDGNTVGRTAETYVVVYDPTGGFVTGGGWIISPAGACKIVVQAVCAPDATGRANFGFVSMYQKGASVPSGNTEFQFHAGNLDFKSTNYQWLVVAGARAQYKGEGTINGITGSVYGFLLTAKDSDMPGGGTVDQFRIKIWDKLSGAVVYDNGGGSDDPASGELLTSLGGGNISIKSK